MASRLGKASLFLTLLGITLLVFGAGIVTRNLSGGMAFSFPERLNPFETESFVSYFYAITRDIAVDVVEGGPVAVAVEGIYIEWRYEDLVKGSKLLRFRPPLPGFYTVSLRNLESVTARLGVRMMPFGFMSPHREIEEVVALPAFTAGLAVLAIGLLANIFVTMRGVRRELRS